MNQKQIITKILDFERDDDSTIDDYIIEITSYIGDISKASLEWYTTNRIPENFGLYTTFLAATTANLVQAFSPGSKIEQLIIDERDRQTKKWGCQNHNPCVWLTILSEEVGELASEIITLKFDDHALVNLLTEAVQVAAVAVQIIEWLETQTTWEIAA